MKKQTKRVFGLCGLAVVGVTTAIAASLPAPITAATDGNMSSTDTVIVRVVSDKADVNVGGVENGSVVISPSQKLIVDYSDGVKMLSAKLIYTDINGNTDTYNFETKDVDYHSGVWELPVDLTSLVGEGGIRFGYGHYKFVAEGTGHSGVPDTDALEFDYVAAIGGFGGEDDDYNVIVNIESDGKYPTELKVYDKDNNPIACVSTTVPAGTTQTILPFADCGMMSGEYKIVLSSIGPGGNVISTYAFMIDYIAPGELPVPNTGSITAGLNISRTDYLITGLIIFGIIAVLGIVAIVRRRKSSKK